MAPYWHPPLILHCDFLRLCCFRKACAVCSTSLISLSISSYVFTWFLCYSFMDTVPLFYTQNLIPIFTLKPSSLSMLLMIPIDSCYTFLLRILYFSFVSSVTFFTFFFSFGIIISLLIALVILDFLPNSLFAFSSFLYLFSHMFLLDFCVTPSWVPFHFFIPKIWSLFLPFSLISYPCF